MKLVKPDFLMPFDLYDDKINLLVIENKNMFYSFAKELYDLTMGKECNIVLSENDIPIKISKVVDLVTYFIPFEINNKKILTKLYDKLNKASAEPELFADTYNIELQLRSYIVKLCDNYSFELEFDDNIDIKSLLKAVNLRFSENYDTLPEKLFEYMTNMRDLDGDKLFVLVNFCTYVSNEDLQLFVETVVNHRFNLLLIESRDTMSGNNVNKRVIDNDLCEF